MATLTVWKFDTATGADEASVTLESLQTQGLITVADAATVSWAAGRRAPKTRQGFSTTAAGATGGAFWGLLFGLIFFMPLVGAAIGAATGALGGALTDVGIDDGFINSVREQVTPGTSALFLLSSNAVLDKVHDALATTGVHGELIQSNLTNEQEAALREVFHTD